MADIHSAIANRQNLMAHAPTGSGKSDSALSPAISFAIENGKDVFFLTPKISQHRIAIEVISELGEKHGLAIRAVDLIGRKHACIDKEVAGLEGEGFYHICELKRKKGRCPFYNNIAGKGLGGKEAADKALEEILGGYKYGKTHGEIIGIGKERNLCPYELMLKIGSNSNVIIGDYYHLLVPQIRDSVLGKTKKQIGNSIVIIDEAHNLASRVRDYLSSSINTFTMRRVEKELRLAGFKPPQLDQPFDDWAKQALGKKGECSVAKEDFYGFLSLFDSDFYSKLEDAGIAFAISTGKKSACLRFMQFIDSWDDGIECVRIAKRGEFGFLLSKRMLDPSALTGVLNESHATILMSGTLLPLEMHEDVLGLDKNRTIMKAYPSPFSRESLVNIICTGVTTKFPERTEENYMKIAERINNIAAATPGGTAVFFPSYNVMNRVAPLLKAGGMFVQTPEMKPKEIRQLLDDFTKSGGMLCGVQGGSLAEGVDYCRGEIKTIVIVGVALDEMSLEIEALIDYYNKKFGKGWEYGYLYPGTIKALQAAGRGRRKESDRVAVVYMDERFKWKKYNWIFDKNEKVLITSEPEKYVKEFWSEGKAKANK